MQHTEQLAPRAAATSPLTLPRSLVERMRLRSRRQHEWLRTALGEPHSRSRADAPTAHPAPPARSEPSHRPVALWLTHCPHWAETPPLALLPASRETPPLCSTRYTRSLCIAPGFKARAARYWPRCSPRARASSLTQSQSLSYPALPLTSTQSSLLQVLPRHSRLTLPRSLVEQTCVSDPVDSTSG